MNKSTIFHGPSPFSKGWFRDSIAFVWSFPSTHWWAVKMLTKMRWWQRMGKSRGKGPKRRVTSPATFPKTFLSIISWSFQNTSTFLYSKFWTIFNKLNWSSLTLGTKFKSVYSIVSVNQFFFVKSMKISNPKLSHVRTKWVGGIERFVGSFPSLCHTILLTIVVELLILDHAKKNLHLTT